MFNAKIGRLSRVLAVALPALLAAIPSFRTHAEVQLPAAGEWVHFTEESGLPANHVDRVIETPAGSIWAVTSGGLAWYDGFRWNAAPPEVGCGSGWMGLVAEPFGRDQLLVVREGHFFIGDRSGFKEIVLPHLGAAADQLVHAIEGPDGRLLFECGLPKFPYSVRIFVREGERLTELETPNKPARPVGLPSLTRTASGQVFMRTERGLYRLTSKGYKAVNTEGPWEGAWGVAEGASGHGFVFVYAQGETGGLWEWSPGGPARKSEDWTENIVTAMAVASNGAESAGGGMVHGSRRSIFPRAAATSCPCFSGPMGIFGRRPKKACFSGGLPRRSGPAGGTEPRRLTTASRTSPRRRTDPSGSQPPRAWRSGSRMGASRRSGRSSVRTFGSSPRSPRTTRV